MRRYTDPSRLARDQRKRVDQVKELAKKEWKPVGDTAKKEAKKMVSGPKGGSKGQLPIGIDTGDLMKSLFKRTYVRATSIITDVGFRVPHAKYVTPPLWEALDKVMVKELGAFAERFHKRKREI